MNELKNIIHHALEKNAMGFEKSFDSIMNDKIDGVLNSALDNHFSNPEPDIFSEDTETDTTSEIETVSEEIIKEALETDE